MIFFLYCGCISLSDSYKNPEKAENENDREESKDNTNKELKVIKLPDYVERITDVLQVFDDLVSVKDQESYEVSPEIEKIYPSVTIVASFANETPSWLSDKLFWKNDEKEISLNFVFIRENISLSLLEEDKVRSRNIPQSVKDAVWRRAEGKCEVCGIKENLEFDHIIPFSRGGANTYRNIQLLCVSCNRKKYNHIG